MDTSGGSSGNPGGDGPDRVTVLQARVRDLRWLINANPDLDVARRHWLAQLTAANAEAVRLRYAGCDRLAARLKESRNTGHWPLP